MRESNVTELHNPAQTDGLTELIRNGARGLIEKAVEAELNDLLEQMEQVRLLDGRKAVVRNGYLPERQVQTGIGPVTVRVPKVRDRSGGGIKFNSRLLPPYLRRSQSMEELLPWLYLKGVSTGDFGEALESLLGKQAVGLSPGVISKLKLKWTEEHQSWSERSLKGKHYVYIWADAVYFPIRGEESKQCILVVLGATPEGKKELLALEEGYRESSESWRVLLRSIRERGLTIAPSLAIADGALGFWKALSDVYPETQQQRCWFHKISNVLDKLPKSMHGAARQQLKQIQMAPTKKEAQQQWTKFVNVYEDKYPGAVAVLNKSKAEMLAFFNFPAKHWVHIRTSNVIESVFSTVRLRTAKTRNCVSRRTILSLVYRLVSTAEKRWNRLRGSQELGKVITGIKFIDGIEATEIERLEAA